jgi:hypothetical protein
MPEDYMNTLVVAHDIVSEQKSDSRSKLPLWLWSRQHAYNVIKKLMKDAGIAPGKHRPPKGLRHAYGVNAKTKDIPLEKKKQKLPVRCGVDFFREHYMKMINYKRYTKSVSIGSRTGELLHYNIKGYKDTYAVVLFKDGSIEKIFHKKIKYI